MAVLHLSQLPASHRTLLRAVVAACHDAGETALVGGLLRDLWLGRAPGQDIDIAVPGGALAAGRRLATALGAAFVPLDPERGAARVVDQGRRVDLTDFRGPSLVQDLGRRDYTVNALGVPLRELLGQGSARVVDPTGGLADLATRRLRLAGPSALRDDPLRTLRGVRLEATLGLRLHPGAVQAIRRAAPDLARVAPERIRDEFQAILGVRHTARALRRADRLGLLAVVVPEVEPMRATRQPKPHRFAVLEHSLRAVEGADSVTAEPVRLIPLGEELAAHLAEPLGGGLVRGHVLKLAALLHDVAKPDTRRRVGNRIRFFEHDVRGAVKARAIAERLRLPTTVADVLERLVRHHLRPMHLAGAGRITERARYRFYRDLGPDTRDVLLLALVDAAAVRGRSPFRTWRQARLLRDLLGGWEVQRRVEAEPPLLRGEDVMTHFRLEPGPAVGRLLRRAREAQDRGLVASREEALAYLDSPESDSLE